jgi:hypothetical protein
VAETVRPEPPGALRLSWLPQLQEVRCEADGYGLLVPATQVRPADAAVRVTLATVSHRSGPARTLIDLADVRVRGASVTHALIEPVHDALGAIRIGGAAPDGRTWLDAWEAAMGDATFDDALADPRLAAHSDPRLRRLRVGRFLDLGAVEAAQIALAGLDDPWLRARYAFARGDLGVARDALARFVAEAAPEALDVLAAHPELTELSPVRPVVLR